MLYRTIANAWYMHNISSLEGIGKTDIEAMLTLNDKVLIVKRLHPFGVLPLAVLEVIEVAILLKEYYDL